MLFVPCRAGVSHAPDEWADKDAVALGAGVLLEAIKTLDRDLQDVAAASEPRVDA
jgi:N-carbamoyl-L-amino-acid hydrolase